MPTIDLIAGARPNFVKIAPIIRAIELAKKNGSSLEYRLVHTGQHYDSALSGSFFRDLGIPDPDVNLDSGSGSQAQQTSKIMIAYEKLLQKSPSDLCLVVGDVTSTMATAIVARKNGILVAHVEAGIRSGDWSMPEEINRVVTDSITNLFFTTSVDAGKNLLNSGVDAAKIHFSGNTMIDSLLANTKNFREPKVWSERNLESKGYIVLTLHRPSNVDDDDLFMQTLSTIGELAEGFPIVYPAHPRTISAIKNFRLPDNIMVIEPLSYLNFNYLVLNSLAVVTDSGGITEETTVFGVPCMTLRDNTERPETISIGTNELVGSNPENLKPHFDRLFSGKWKKGAIPEKWDGNAAARIVSVLSGIMC